MNTLSFFDRFHAPAWERSPGRSRVPMLSKTPWLEAATESWNRTNPIF